MAMCPNCQVDDKPFFAPKCYSCNTRVGLIEQTLFQLFYVTATLGMFVGGLWLIKVLLVG